MTQEFTETDRIKKIIAFHGHMCPGLALGIRASEIALKEIGPHSRDEEMVAVVETDMCGVDAIQFLTGCTFGKGNLIHLDYGKNAFSFYRRSDGSGVRIVAKPELFGQSDPEWEELIAKLSSGGLTAEEEQRFQQKKDERTHSVLAADSEKLFDIDRPSKPMPRSARIMTSLTCEQCGERVMESRIRKFRGKTLCIPCFEQYERKW